LDVADGGEVSKRSSSADKLGCELAENVRLLSQRPLKLVDRDLRVHADVAAFTVVPTWAGSDCVLVNLLVDLVVAILPGAPLRCYNVAVQSRSLVVAVTGITERHLEVLGKVGRLMLLFASLRIAISLALVFDEQVTLESFRKCIPQVLDTGVPLFRTSLNDPLACFASVADVRGLEFHVEVCASLDEGFSGVGTVPESI
jgi:hypothetical protein